MVVMMTILKITMVVIMMVMMVMKKIGHLQSHVGPDKVTSPNTWHPFIVAGWRWLWWFFQPLWPRNWTCQTQSVPIFCDDALSHVLKYYSNPHTFVIVSDTDHFNDLDNLLNLLLFSRSWRTPMTIMLPYTFCSWIDLRHRSPPCQIWAGIILLPLLVRTKANYYWLINTISSHHQSISQVLSIKIGS